MNNFFVIGGACPRRKVDAQTIINYFKKNDYLWVDNVSYADFIVIVTCGGFNSSEKTSIETIKKIIAEKKKKSQIIVTGCLPKINPKSLEQFQEIKLIDYTKMSKLDSLISAKIKFNSIPTAGAVQNIPSLVKPPIWKKIITQFQFHKEFLNRCVNFVKNKKYRNKYGYQPIFYKDVYNIMIARGCRGNCSYCSIRYAHGKLKSKPIDEIIKNFEKGLSEKYDKFVLIAEDVGCYGLDIKTNIVELFKKIFSYENDFKLIINDFNPQWMIKYFDELLPILVENKKRIKDIRMPIQSASNKTLKAMRRPYKIEDVEKCLNVLNKKIPDIEIRTHFIVGFPGETDDDFQKSVDFLKKYDIAGVAIYDYQERFITDSAKMKNKVPEKIKKQRAKLLRQIVYS